MEYHCHNERIRESKDAINFDMRDEKVKKPKKDANVCLEIQSVIAAMALVSHWFAITMSILTSSVINPIYRQLIPVYSARSPLSRTQLPFCTSYIKFIALFIKLFEDIQDILMYKRLFAVDDSNNEEDDYYYLYLLDSFFGSTNQCLGFFR